MKRKLVAMTMACTLAATALTGCGGSSNGGSSSAADTKTDSAAAESTAAETTASDAEGSVLLSIASNRSRISSGRIWQKLTPKRPAYR